MIDFERTEVWGFEHAFRGMRNPMNSWNKSDSRYCAENDHCDECILNTCNSCCSYLIGENDMNLAQKLIKGGSEHRKFLRQIFVSVDITAPLYWWKEFDTYKVGTVANSCSTMHKIAEKAFTLEDFSREHLLNLNDSGAGFDYSCIVRDHENKNELMNGECVVASFECLKLIVDVLNTYRHRYLKTKDKKYWWQMIQLLPSSYNQTRTVTMTYENLLNMYRQRKSHKLDEWRVGFIEWIENLPYAKELIMYTGEDE